MRMLRAALRRVLMAAAATGVLWLAGLLWFATPPPPDSRSAPTDAIVVVTGGSLRIRSGLDLLREGKGGKLFISGVGQRADLDELVRMSGSEPPATNLVSCCVVLGHDADNTFGNAQETAGWIRDQGFHSLRLVTAWYHMRRARLEFQRAMPEIDIVPHPVFPNRVNDQRWWASRRTAALLVVEYSKYLATLARPLIERRQSAEPGTPETSARAEARR
jgi:uncharacterized SAM-binding protein YcdF (DUF218 family)